MRAGVTMSRYLALLRGTNVGGKNMLPMKALAARFAEAGCRDVMTCIQSGNVVFGAEAKVVVGPGEKIVQEVAAQFRLCVLAVCGRLRTMPHTAEAMYRALV